ncbi:hypothetical protein BGX38DRAFT_1176332, partial [Terfezia claveryi]
MHTPPPSAASRPHPWPILFYWVGSAESHRRTKSRRVAMLGKPNGRVHVATR